MYKQSLCVITFVGDVILVVVVVVVNSLVRSVDSVDIDSELEIGTVIATDSILFLIEIGEWAACATVTDKVVDCDSVVSATIFDVVDVEVEVEGDSCEVVDVEMDDVDGCDGCVTSNDGYL